jgi:acyl carrier protein
VEINERIKRCIIGRLELDLEPSKFDDDAPLFAPMAVGGMELDSLGAIEIVVALSVEFGLQLDEVPREAFSSVGTLAAYIQQQLELQGE